VVHEKETEAAREKQNAIKDEWKRWLWNDAERADRIVDIYNDKMNRIVNWKFDGTHLTFPGMKPVITPLEHQKNDVWLGLHSYQVLYTLSGQVFGFFGKQLEVHGH
jgi:N12 class adenine-specific DNA methylase